MELKYRRIAQALEGLLREGEHLVVSQIDGEVEIRELAADDGGIPSPLADTDPELYGFLLVVNDRVSSATGCAWMLALLGMTVAACGAIGRFRPEFSLWWVYTIIVLLAGAILVLGIEWRAQLAYWNHRRELFEKLAARSYTRDRLLAAIAGDERLKNLASRLVSDDAAEGQ